MCGGGGRRHHSIKQYLILRRNILLTPLLQNIESYPKGTYIYYPWLKHNTCLRKRYIRFIYLLLARYTVWIPLKPNNSCFIFCLECYLFCRNYSPKYLEYILHILLIFCSVKVVPTGYTVHWGALWYQKC